MPILSSCHLSVPSRDTVKSKYFKNDHSEIQASSFKRLSDYPEAEGYELGNT